MKSNIPSSLPGLSRSVDNRYLHIGGAFAVGGAFTQVGSQKVFVPIPTVASAELPLTGGFSTAKTSKWSLNASKVKFGPMPRAEQAKLKRTELVTVAGAAVTCKSKHVAPDQPKGATVSVEVKGVRIEGGFSLKLGILNLDSEQSRDERFPKITLGPTKIEGLRLGKHKVTVEVDRETFNKYPTLESLEPALAGGDKSISPQVVKGFLRNSDGSLHRNGAGYTIGSIVKSITGVPPEWIEPNGYTIVWPGFGKVILGEILIGAFVRRVTLIRLKHCDIEIGGGCDGGSSWP